MKTNAALWSMFPVVCFLAFSAQAQNATDSHDLSHRGFFRFIFPTTRSVELASGECTTRDGKIGTCVHWSDCPTVPKIFGIPRNAPPICKWEGLRALICCPPDPTLTTTVMPTLERIGDNSQPTSSACIQMPADAFGTRTLVKRQLGAFSGILDSLGIGLKRKQTSSTKPFILGGVDAKIGAWPFMVAIFLKVDSAKLRPFCGGALIDHSTVLTAAHCFIEEEPGMEYAVIVGDTNLGRPDDVTTPIHVEVSQVIKHEGYKYPIVYDDIAILKLKTKIPYTGAAKPICLPEKGQMEDIDKARSVIIGWGHTEFGGRYAKTLQQADLPIVNNTECDVEYKALGETIAENLPQGITNKIICAGNRVELKDACQADSGGPMVMKDPNSNKALLVGVISAGYECGRGVPGLYTRVTQYLDWINDKIDK